MTVVLTTHYMEEAGALCDRVALMHRGKLAALGTGATLEDVFRHHTGADLADDLERGGLRSVRSTRRAARRVG
jgi:ABC-2 type transport system ATP-binding protein